MSLGDRAAGKAVSSRFAAAAWLLATILLPYLAPAAELQARPEPSGVSDGSASLVAQARLAESSVLPRGLPRLGETETLRQKASRSNGSGDGKLFGIIPEQPPLAPVDHLALTPVRCRDVPRSATVRAFEPRGPPRLAG